MNTRQFPTAEEVERIICTLEEPMTVTTISKMTGVRGDHTKFALKALRFQGLVRSKRVKNRTLWFRRGHHA